MAQRDEKEHELKVLLGQTPKSMWVRDLDEFMVQWEVGPPSALEGVSERSTSTPAKPSPCLVIL